MISGVPPPLGRSVGRSVGRSGGLQCNIIEEQCNRWRGGGILGPKFVLTVLRALIGGMRER